MAEFKGRMYLLSALYHTRSSFSSLPGFMKQIGFHFNSLPYNRSSVLNKVQQLYEQYLNVNYPISDDEALSLMLARDLRNIQEILSDDSIAEKIASRYDIEATLSTCRDAAVKILHEEGIFLSPPQLEFVENLPYPYSLRGYSAFTADLGDYQKYGMEPGIYFPKGRLRPFYSEFLLLHELVHVILGADSPYFLARGLEEGLAELIGAMYLSTKILGKDLTINLFIYNRLSGNYQRFWELYLDATRLATLLHQRFGLEGVLALLNKGREELKRVENYCYRLEFNKIQLPKGETDSELLDVSDFLTLVYSRNLIVSPLAKYLTYYIRPKRSVEEMLTQARVDKVAGRRALKELENTVNLVSFSSDIETSGEAIVDWTDCDRLCEGPTIRYEIPATSSK